MLKKILNELIVSLNISPDGPVLIKSGAVGLGTDMCFVTTVRDGKTEVYLPGSSLKGVIRSHGEKICRTLQPKSVCEPFNMKDTNIDEKNRDFISCSQVFNKVDYWKKEGASGNNSQSHYAASCPACRMFGSLKFKGRCFIDDAYAVGKAPEPYIRDGVGIERYTGAAKRGAKYDFEVITEGTFATKLRLVNFEMWQLALLSFILHDLLEGEIRIGMAASRGLGKIKTEITAVEYHRLGKKPEKLELLDIYALEKDNAEIEHYAFDKPDVSVVDGFTGEWHTRGIRHCLQIAPSNLLDKITERIGATLAAYLDRNPERERIKEHYYRPGRKRR